MRTSNTTTLRGVDSRGIDTSGGSLRDMRFSGRGYYDDANSPSVFTMRHDTGALQFRIERSNRRTTVVRVHSEELHNEFPGLAAKLPALTREEVFQLRDALGDSKPFTDQQKTDLAKLKRELGRVFDDTSRPGNTKPKTPRSVEKLQSAVREAWGQTRSREAPVQPYPLGPSGRDDAGSEDKFDP